MRGFPLTRTLRVVFTSHEVAFGVVIRGVELNDLVKTKFWFRLRLRRLRSSENWLWKSQAEAEEVIGLFLRFFFRFRQSVRRKWKPSDSSDSDAFALTTLLMTPIFDFHTVISALTTLLATPTPTHSLMKTSLYGPNVFSGTHESLTWPPKLLKASSLRSLNRHTRTWPVQVIVRM